jgi:hypothetical protein
MQLVADLGTDRGRGGEDVMAVVDRLETVVEEVPGDDRRGDEHRQDAAQT